MATGAIYAKATGLIQQTITPPLSNEDQLAGLSDDGLLQIIIPDGKNGSTGMICLATSQYVDFAPAGPPVPNIMTQYIAAQINAGNIPASSFHPATLIDINSTLSASNMASIDMTSSTVSPAATDKS